MKCPQCGFVSPEARQHCAKCGSVLRMPEWRKEVSQKVRAYGERRKSLTTPPEPLKKEGNHQPIEEPNLEEEPFQLASVAQSPVPQATESPATGGGSREVIKQKPRETPAEKPPPAFTLSPESLLELQQGVSEEGITLRRLIGFAIDSTIIIVLFSVCLFLFASVTDYQLSLAVRPTLLAGFLVVHFLYYVSFFRASGQTPGMLFVALELRDAAGTPRPGTGKIIVRWAAMVLLNVFNVLPLLAGRRELLLDQLSRTQIRSLK